MPVLPLPACTRPGVEGELTCHGLIQLARSRAAGGRQDHLQHQIQVARRLSGNAAPFQAQLAALLRAGRHGHLTCPAGVATSMCAPSAASQGATARSRNTWRPSTR